MDWTRILAYITGSVDRELLLRNEYLAAENRILRAQLNGCLRLSDAERATLGEIGFRLGRKALSEVATVAQRDRGKVALGPPPCANDHCLARLDSQLVQIRSTDSS
jgi:hypothetical protein